jgi:hypothetical protein
MGKSGRTTEKRKVPRPAILRLAEQLRDDARRSGNHADAVVADLVSSAWLLDVRRKGNRAIEHSTRALLATADGTHVAERSTPRSLPAPGVWWEALQRVAAPRRDSLEQVRGAKTPRRLTPIEQRFARSFVAKAMVEHAIALVPGVETNHDAAVARLLLRLEKRTPKDAAELARWTLTACEVPGTRTNAADAGVRGKKRRTVEK